MFFKKIIDKIIGRCSPEEEWKKSLKEFHYIKTGITTARIQDHPNGIR